MKVGVVVYRKGGLVDDVRVFADPREAMEVADKFTADREEGRVNPEDEEYANSFSVKVEERHRVPPSRPMRE